ncbi:uncharacterized protein LOC116337870 [Contarinia nasturtii]|uniref:uncharacterized protein LOC116337870 n=1 Tax=Contarinia nasturtii TaxID=265458 RepID=UPI0012D4BF46|nr:uncharacterized protein LOC116337870 [Contarinia nasturtii]
MMDRNLFILLSVGFISQFLIGDVVAPASKYVENLPTRRRIYYNKNLAAPIDLTKEPGYDSVDLQKEIDELYTGDYGRYKPKLPLKVSSTAAKSTPPPDVVVDKHVVSEENPKAVHSKSKTLPPVKVGKPTPQIERDSSFTSVKDRVKEIEEKISKSP